MHFINFHANNLATMKREKTVLKLNVHSFTKTHFSNSLQDVFVYAS